LYILPRVSPIKIYSIGYPEKAKSILQGALTSGAMPKDDIVDGLNNLDARKNCGNITIISNNSIRQLPTPISPDNEISSTLSLSKSYHKPLKQTQQLPMKVNQTQALNRLNEMMRVKPITQSSPYPSNHLQNSSSINIKSIPETPQTISCSYFAYL
jgi:hypothetical protein